MPAPFAPVTTSASPAAMRKSSGPAAAAPPRPTTSPEAVAIGPLMPGPRRKLRDIAPACAGKARRAAAGGRRSGAAKSLSCPPFSALQWIFRPKAIWPFIAVTNLPITTATTPATGVATIQRRSQGPRPAPAGTGADKRKWSHPHLRALFRSAQGRSPFGLILVEKERSQLSHAPDSFNSRRTLSVGGKDYVYYDLKEAEKNGLQGVARLPFSLKVLLENLLRNEDDRTVKADDIRALARWIEDKGSAGHEIAYRPARVLMQDFTGVPAVVDLAAMRDATKCARRRPQEGQPAGSRRSRHRPFGDGRLFRPQGCLRQERRRRIRPQRRALQLPALGLRGLRELPRRASRHRHLPPGQSRISRPDRLDP